MTWQKLGDICEFKYGSSLPAASRSGDAFPVYGSNGVVGTHLQPLTGGPTIVVGRKGSIGEVNFSEGPCWPIDTTYFIDDTATKADLRWLSYTLSGLRLGELNKATGVPGLNRNDAYERLIFVPPLEEQKRIAAILDQADELRRKRQRALSRLNQLGQALFIEMFGAFHDDFGVWPIHRLETLVKDAQIGAVRGSNEMGDDKAVKYLRMDSIDTDGGLRFEGLKRVDASEADLSKYGLLVGDLIFNTRNSKELVGKSAVVRTPFDGIYNNNILRIRFNNGMTADFLDAFFRTRKGQVVLGAIKAGTTSVFAIYQKSLLALDVPVPPIDLQHRYSDRLRELFSLQKQNALAVSEGSNLFASLQHRAFRGEL